MYASMGSFMAAKTVHVDSLTSPNKFLFKRQMTFIQYLQNSRVFTGLIAAGLLHMLPPLVRVSMSVCSVVH